MTQPDRIHLRDHTVLAEIGAFQSERGRDQRLRFAITVDLAVPVSGVEDQVDRILSYDVLTQAIDTALSDQRYNLVETLAERIAAEVLANPKATRVQVTVEKLDRGPGALGITICRDAARVAVQDRAQQVWLLVWRRPTALPEGATIILPDNPGLPLPEGGDRRRIALLALDQAAWALAGTLGLEVAETRTELDHAIRFDRPVIWAPARLAFDAPEAGADTDRLTFWLAERLSATGIRFSQAAPLPALPEGVTIPISRIEE